MTRPVLNLMTVLSLLTCVAAGALWARSCFVTDVWEYNRLRPATKDCQWRQHSLVAGFGSLYYEYQSLTTSDTATLTNVRREPPDTLRHRTWGRVEGSAWWVRYYDGPANNTFWQGHHWNVVCPMWVPVLASGVLPLARLRRRHRRRRQANAGMCPHCGYDLRATPGRCPECGAAADRGSIKNGVIRPLTSRTC
jgi:hypothetical protein